MKTVQYDSGATASFPDYTQSEFDQPGPLEGGDDLYERIEKNLISLKEFIDEKRFKSYEDLQASFAKAMATAPSVPQGQTIAETQQTTQQPQQQPQAQPPVSNVSENVTTQPETKFNAETDAPPFDAPEGDDEDDSTFFSRVKNQAKKQ